MPDITVTIRTYRAPDTVIRAYTRDLMVTSAAKVHELLTEESAKRSDSLGGPDGAVDTGLLSGSFEILSVTDVDAWVGTRVRYAERLARGLPDPDVMEADIAGWAKRKRLPLRPGFSRAVANKIRTKGPIPNPFHVRAHDRFIELAPGLIAEVTRRHDQ